MKVVVTGASGAVGSYATEILADEGHTVVAVDLPTASFIKRRNVYPYRADLTKMTYLEIQELVTDADAIIHTAAIVDIGKSKDEVWPLNVEVTRALAAAASKEFFCKFIHISSGSLYAPCEGPIKESYNLEPTSAYELSKVHSEAAVEVVGENSSRDFMWTILRPALIYGPKARFLGATLAAIPPILKLLGVKFGLKGGPITNWVHAEDVARAAIHCINAGDTDNKTFNVADDSPSPFGDTTSDYMEAYGMHLYARLPLLPQAFLRLLKPVINRNLTFKLINLPLRQVWKLIKSFHILSDCLSVKVDKEASPYIFHNTVFDNTALKETGFKYKWPNPKEAIPSVLKWYQNHAWIP